MQITRNAIETMAGPSEWFTGAVYIDAAAAPSGRSAIRSPWRSKKPSDGLEPSTPPYHLGSRQLVATYGNGFRQFEPFSWPLHLPLVATGCARSALSEEGLLVKFSTG